MRHAHDVHGGGAGRSPEEPSAARAAPASAVEAPGSAVEAPASAVEGLASSAPHDPAREANLLGALALAVGDRLRDAAESGAGQRGSAVAALVSLAGYLDGQPIDRLRGPLNLSHSATVRVVDRLVSSGLAERRPGEDRRSVCVALTPAGFEAARRATEGRERALEEAFAGLDRAERAELTRLHEKVLAALTDGRASAGKICRLCDVDACGHHRGQCPVTEAATAAEERRAAASA